MKMNKRLLSGLLALVMVLGMFPLAAIATDDTTPEVTHIEGCSAECANAEGSCACTCHTPAPVDDDPVDNCDNCDDPACTGCTPDIDPLSDGGEEEDPLCDKCNATRNEDNTISHEPTCEKLQYVPTCTGKIGCPVENCPNQHCTGDENCPIENCECKQPKESVIDGSETDPLCDQCEATKEGEKIVHADGCPNKPLCDKCGTTEKNEDGTPKHAEKCEELCLCEAVIEGYHSNVDCPFYVEPTEPTTEPIVETTVAAETECVCDNADGDHNEDCPEYVAVVVGDSASILARLTQLEEMYQHVTKKTAKPFFAKMMDAYRAAFDNDRLVVSESDIERIDDHFGKLQSKLYKDFGFTEIPAASSAKKRLFSFGSKNASARSVTGGVFVDKYVNDNSSDISDFLLTLESYVTGEAIDYVTPVDLVLVLDQSASMYTPMGLANHIDNEQVYTENASELIRYSLDSQSSITALSLRDAFNSTEKDSAGLTFKDKVSQLGYLIAQSRTGGYVCEGGANHQHVATCKEYDWFVVQYVESDAKPWHLYRVKSTTIPSTDANTSSEKDAEGNNVYNVSIVKYNDFAEMGNSHFYFYKTQTGALYDSITAFAAALKASGGNHRLAVASFASGNEASKNYATFGSGMYVNGNYIKYNNIPRAANSSYTVNGKTYTTNNSGYFIEPAAFYDTATITPSQYASALMNIQDNYTGVMSSINAVKTDYYGTYQNVGLDIALNIIKNATEVSTDLEDYDREKIVVLFTDGAPSGPKNGDIVAKAAEVKATGAKLYTICTSTLSPENRAFLSYSSSDYPDATGSGDVMNPGNSISGAPVYAKTAKNAEELKKEFLSIVEDVGGADVQLGADTVMKDIISQYFVLPESLTRELIGKSEAEALALVKQYIKVYTAAYLGNDVFDDKVAFENAEIELVADETGNYRTIKITNYDYSANFISENGRGQEEFKGNKLIVEIPIDPNPDFLGGDDVITNGDASGIYSGDNPVAKFPLPNVDVAVTPIKPITSVKNIYISQTASLPELIKLGEYDKNGSHWAVDGINNDYVDIVYTIEADGMDPITYTIPAGTSFEELTDHGWSEDANTHPLLLADQTYTVTCTVTSVSNANNSASDNAQPKILVYKPVILFNDSEIELGDTADYADNGGFGEDIVWKHGDDVADVSEMGAAPTLEYTYDPVAAAFTEDTPVKVTVTSTQDLTNSIPVNMDITQHVTFFRDACAYDGCDNTTKTQVAVTNTRINFKVHVKSFDLTIIKDFPEGADYTIDDGQSFVFNITGPNNFKKTVIIEGEGEVTIAGLPVGTYTITEDTDWSWRYDCYVGDEKTNSQQVQPAAVSNGEASVTFVNKREETQWLDGNAFAANKFTPLKATNLGIG